MRHPILLLTICGAAVTLASGQTPASAPARADDVAPPAATSAEYAKQRETVLSGNERYRDGQFDAALEKYQTVGDAPADKLDAELLHNKAAALYKLGRIDEARELWTRAAAQRDAAFEAKARYNLGNCDYSAALKLLEEQKAGEAIEPLERARGNYVDAVRLDPRHTDARANLELASQLLQQAREQAEQQQDQQQQSGDQQSEQQQGDGEQQQGDQQQENEQQGSQDQQQQGQQGQPQDQQQQGSQSQQQSGDQQNPQDQQGQPDGQDQDAPPQPQGGEQQEGKDQAPPRDVAQSGEQESQDADDKAGQPLRMSQTEAERLLQMIRDAEKQRREAIKAATAASQRPVEKDW